MKRIVKDIDWGKKLIIDILENSSNSTFKISYKVFDCNVNIYSDTDIIINCLSNLLYCEHSLKESKDAWCIKMYQNKSLIYHYLNCFEENNIILDYGLPGTVKDVGDCYIIMPFETRSIILSFPQKKEIYVVSLDLSGLVIDSSACLRVIFNGYLLRKGAYLVHASGIQYKNKGYLFVGGNGTGKTTIALHFLLYPECDAFVSNDMVWCMNTIDRHSYMVAWPDRINLRLDTLKALENNKIKLTSRLHFDAGGIAFLLKDFKYLPNNLSLIKKSNFSENAKRVHILPFELSKAFNKKIINHSLCNCVIFPEITNESVIKIEQLTKEQAYLLIRKNARIERMMFNDWLGIYGDHTKWIVKSMRNIPDFLTPINYFYKFITPIKDLNKSINLLKKKIDDEIDGGI